MLKVFTSIFLIAIVLLGAVGVNYDSHYCGGVLVDQQLSFTASELSCGMPSYDVKVNSSDESSTNISEVCCSNEHIGFQITDEYNDYQAPSIQFISNSSFPVVNFEYVSFIQETEYCFIGYSPPPLRENILLKKESLLI